MAHSRNPIIGIDAPTNVAAESIFPPSSNVGPEKIK